MMDAHAEAAILAEYEAASKKREQEWQTVPSKSKGKKPDKEGANKAGGAAAPGSKAASTHSAFASLEDEAKQRRARIEEARKAQEEGAKEPLDSDEELEFEGYGEGAAAGAAAAAAAEKPKEKKPKKPKVTVAEAASKISHEELSAFLIQIAESFPDMPDVQLMRCADFFAKAFANVTPSLVNIPKITKESGMAKALEVPLHDVPEPVVSAAATWLSSKPADALGKFLMLLVAAAVEDIVPPGKPPKGQPLAPPKAKVGMLVMLAIVSRTKPDVVVQQGDALRADAALHTQDRLPVLAWLYGQVAHTELVLGMWLWARNLLPLASGKAGTPVSRDVILTFLESVLLKNFKRARAVLINGAVRKGERVVPPSALDLYLRLAFPATDARTKATERFAAHYLVIKEVALAGSAKGRTSKAAALQLFPLSLAAADQESTSREACSIAVWCLAENIDCYKQWERHHMEGLGASLQLMTHLLQSWTELRGRLEPFDALQDFLSHIKTKHHAALEPGSGTDAATLKHVRRVESVRQQLHGKLSILPACIRATSTLVAVAAMAYGFYLLSPSKNPWGWDGYILLSKTHSFLGRWSATRANM